MEKMTTSLEWVEKDGGKAWTANANGFQYSAHHWPVPDIWDLKLKWDDLSRSSIGQGSLGTVQHYAQSHANAICAAVEEVEKLGYSRGNWDMQDVNAKARKDNSRP